MDGYKTKVDIIYEVLMQKIAGGDYQDGDRLVISQISRENGVSDIPVREAVRRLESEGYVSIAPNQGPVVRCFSKERLREIFQIKAVLEGYAARLSIDFLTPEDIRELHQRNDRLRQALEKNDMKEYSRLNVEFHLRLYQNMPQRELYGMIQELHKNRFFGGAHPDGAEHRRARGAAPADCAAGLRPGGKADAGPQNARRRRPGAAD